jgi:hypothetical protein
MFYGHILHPIGKVYGHLVHFRGHLAFFSRFGILYQEKSGNPDTGNDVSRATLRRRQKTRHKKEKCVRAALPEAAGPNAMKMH